MCELEKNELMQILPWYREVKADWFCGTNVINLQVVLKKRIYQNGVCPRSPGLRDKSSVH